MRKLEIEGAIEVNTEFGFEELRALPDQVEDVGALIPGRSGGAVLLSALLKAIGVKPEADYLTVTADDGEFSASVPLSALGEAVLCYREGEAALPRSKGGPIRLLIPGAASCDLPGVDACANVKFLARLEVRVGAGQDTRPNSRTEHEALHDLAGHEHLPED
jgi:DMSO/TMAO reductase YedYZ molybdopterin-dependent catalytic subunit